MEHFGEQRPVFVAAGLRDELYGESGILQLPRGLTHSQIDRLQDKVEQLQKTGKFHNFGRGLIYNLARYYSEKDFDQAELPLRNALTRKELPQDIRARIERLLLENRHSRLIFRAITQKSDVNSLELLKFRKKNNFPLFPWCEQYWGDVCGLKQAQDLREFAPPYIKLPLFWSFKLDPADIGLKENWYLDDPAKIGSWGTCMSTNSYWETPPAHYKQIPAELRKKTAHYDGIAWYAVAVKNLPMWKARRVYLYFGAVDESCWIFVNGQKAGEHLFSNPADAQTPFSIEITPYLRREQVQQTVVVRVEDKNGAGGIWKNVMLVSKKRE